MTTTMAEILQIALRRGACAIRVALPGRVVRVKSTGRVDVRVELKVARPVPDEQYEYDDLGTLMDVPVLFPSTQAAAVTLKLQAGDPGLILFADHALGAWLTAGDTVAPVIPDAHGASGAVFSPGLWPGDEAPEQATDVDVRIEAREGARMEIDGAIASFTAGGSAEFLAKIDSVNARIDSVEASLNQVIPAVNTLAGLTIPLSETPAAEGTAVLKSE